jgi:hypothetical protein
MINRLPTLAKSSMHAGYRPGVICHLRASACAPARDRLYSSTWRGPFASPSRQDPLRLMPIWRCHGGASCHPDRPREPLPLRFPRAGALMRLRSNTIEHVRISSPAGVVVPHQGSASDLKPAPSRRSRARSPTCRWCCARQPSLVTMT